MIRGVVGLMAIVALLWAPAAARADAVRNVSVDNTNPSAAAGARTVYVVAFTTSGTGALSAGMNSSISVTLPAGTGFSGYSGSVLDGTTTIGGCGGAAGTTVTCSLNFGRSVPTDHLVTVQLAGVANPPAATGLTAQVSTSSDTTPAPSAPYSVVAGSPVASVTADNTQPTAAAGGRTVYTVGFTPSSTGGLSADAKSSITVTLPPGTGFAGYTGSVLDGTTTIGGCGGATGTTVTCTLNFARSVAAGHPITVQLAGVTNPPAGTGLTAQVSTSSDTTPAPSAPYSVVAGSPVASVTADNTQPTAAAGGRTVYSVGFTPSSTGGLSADAKSSITVTLPAGTGFAGYTGSVLDGTTTIGGCGGATGTTVTCTLNFARSVAAGHPITVQLAGVTNPPAGTGLTAQVSTSSDTAQVDSGAYSVVAGHSPTDVTADVAPSAAAGARTVYTVGFTTSTTGAMSADAKSSIAVTLPAGTGFAGYTGSVLDGTTTIGGCGGATGTTVTCTLNFARSVAAGHPITVQLAGVTNPPAGTGLTAQVSTSSDTATADSAPYGVVASQAVGSPTVTLGSTSVSAVTRYTIAFTTSSTGGLSAEAKSAITLTFPAGTGFAASVGSVLDGTTTIGGCDRPTGVTMTCTLNFGRSVAASRRITVQVDNVTNPASSSTGNSVRVQTTSDQGTDSAPYAIGADTAAPETSISAGPAGQTSSGSATFTFGSSEPGSTFTCRLDGPSGAGAPQPCTSPKTYTGLAPGSYTFIVIATDPADNADASPATRQFTVAAPTPTPSPTAEPTVSPTPTPTSTPTPTPVPGKTVVAQAVKGTVRIKLPGANTFVDLDGTQGIPVGATVDTRHGTVQLTALQKRGGKAGTASFFAGLFKLTQTKTTTDLTLSEPLAPCPKRGHASAAAKKPRTRKLWGSGHGSFRTRGTYSAATVRGTKWLVQDSCAGTLTKVTQGVVSVRDNVRHKTITLRAGKHYLAHPRR